MIGKLIQPINAVIDCEKLDTHTRSIPRRIVPEVIFQKSLKAREITFAKSPTISRNPRKREIMMSPTLATTRSG